MSVVDSKQEIELAKKRIRDAIAESRLRFEVIINNHFFTAVMGRHKDLGGFPPLNHLEQLFSYAAKDAQQDQYHYHTLYQLIEILAYFVYYWKIVTDIQAEALNFLPRQSANIKVQVKLSLEMLPQNLKTLSDNTRVLLVYLTNLERNETSTPSYKKYGRLYLVEKLISATKPIPEAKKFEEAYDSQLLPPSSP